MLKTLWGRAGDRETKEEGNRESTTKVNEDYDDDFNEKSGKDDVLPKVLPKDDATAMPTTS